MRRRLQSLAILLALLGTLSPWFWSSESRATAAEKDATRECIRIFANPHRVITAEEAALYAKRYDIMVLSSGNRLLVRAMKGINPNLKVYLYLFSVGAWADHDNWWRYDSEEEWFVHDQYGRRIIFTQGNWYLLDVANPDYQQFMVERIVSNAQLYGYDGVYLDRAGFDLIGTPDSKFSSPVPPTKRQTWHSDMSDFLTAVKRGIGGLFALYNTMSPTLRAYQEVPDSDHLALVDAMNMEGFAHPDWFAGDEYLKEVDWIYQTERVKETLQAGKQFFAQPGIDAATTTDIQAFRIKMFALASYLLVTDCQNAYMTFLTDYRPDRDDPTYISRWRVQTGLPRKEMYRKDGIFQRDFDSIKAMVNPSDTQTYTQDLGRTYRTFRDEPVIRVTLKPKESVILLK